MAAEDPNRPEVKFFERSKKTKIADKTTLAPLSMPLSKNPMEGSVTWIMDKGEPKPTVQQPEKPKVQG